jgi:polysaccharide chain length determinant protein (PEP-CTERM system associated)
MDAAEKIDIEKYWQIIYGRRYLCIGISLFCLSVIVWGSYFIPKQYEAKTTVFVEKNIINSLVKNITIATSIEDRLRVISYTMTSRSVLLRVIDELDLVANKDNSAETENLVVSLQSRTQVRMTSNSGGSGTDWFSVTFRDSNPKIARDYVNTLVRIYVEENLSAKKEETYEANKFLTDQRKFFKEKLDIADEKITDFRRSKGVFIAVDERTIIGEIKIAEENLETIKSQKMELEARKNLTERQLREEKPYTVAMFGRTRGDSSDRLLMLQNKLNELLVKFTENYPEVIRVKAEIESMKMNIQNKPVVSEEPQGSETEMTTLNPLHQRLKEELAKLDTDLAALSAKERRIRELIELKKVYLRDIPEEKKILGDFERERDSYKKIDEELVLKLGQSEVSKQMEIQDKAETFRIVDPAILPRLPISPNRVLIIFFGIFASIGAGGGMILLFYHMDPSVKSINELKTIISIPVLAVIAQIVTEEEINRQKKLDKRVYAGSLAYLFIIALDFMREAISRFL